MSSTQEPATPPAAQPKRILRRHDTALLIAAGDLFMLLVVAGSAGVWQLGDGADDALVAVWIGAGLVAIRMILLIANGAFAVFSWMLAVVASKNDATSDATRNNDLAADLAKTRLWFERHYVAYIVFITIGVIGLVVIVAFSGGVKDSPYAQLLLATFVLGQVRAPTPRAVWTLFFVGGAVVAATQAIYWLTSDKIWPDGFEALESGAWLFLAPGVLVALATTLVNWFTVADLANSGNSVNGTPPSTTTDS